MSNAGSAPARSRTPAGVDVIAGAVTAGLVALYVLATLLGGGPSPPGSVDLYVVLEVLALVAVACVAVLAVVRRYPADLRWWVAASAVVLRTGGAATLTVAFAAGRVVTSPSIVDAAFVASDCAIATAVLMPGGGLAGDRRMYRLLDVLAGVLLVSGAVLSAGRATTRPGPPDVRTNHLLVVFPSLAGVILVALVVAAVWHTHPPARDEVTLATGIAVFAGAELCSSLRSLLDDPPLPVMGAFSTLSMAVVVAAVWQPHRPAPESRGAARGPAPRGAHPLPRRSLYVPVVLAALSLVALVVGGARGASPIGLAVLAAATAVAIGRGASLWSYERITAADAVEAAGVEMRRFHALVEASTDLIGLADTSGRVVYVNPAGRRMLGLAADAHIVGLHVGTLVRHAHVGAFEDRWTMLLERGEVVDERELLPLDGGPPVPVAAASFVVRDPASGHPLAVGTIQRDITERRRADAALRDLAEQRAQLLNRLVQAQEEERARIAADVHDDPLQALAAVDLRLGALRRVLGDTAPGAVGSVAVLQDIVATAALRLRDLLFDLESPASEAGLAMSLSQAADVLFAGTDVRWRVVGDADTVLSRAELATSYRIVKEALVNAGKHAGAREVVVEIGTRDDELVVSVRDDGRGIAEDAWRERPGHLGLVSMRDRAVIAGGRLDVERRAEGGTEVRLTLPVQG